MVDLGSPSKSSGPPADVRKAKVSLLEGPRSFPRRVQTDAQTQDTFQSQFRSDVEDFCICFVDATAAVICTFSFHVQDLIAVSCLMLYIILYLVLHVIWLTILFLHHIYGFAN